MKILIMFLTFSSLLIAQEFHIDFPLQIGNIWQYSEGSSYYIESIVICDTIMSNKLTYTKIDGMYFNGFYRKEGTKVYSYHSSLEMESLIFDFSLNVSDTVSWTIYPGATFLTTVSEKGIKRIFGQDRNYMVFFRDDINSTADGYRMIVDGLGFVQYVGEVMAYGCTGAIINGVQFGIILEVDNYGKDILSRFHLLQNYPNPFNPTTTIAYEINKSNEVKIYVYDILGKRVATLCEGYKNVGTHQVLFNGENLSSGVYFYTIIYGNNIETKSMLLLR